MGKRIWELDALRGICILGMVLLHLLYNLDSVGVFTTPAPILFLQNWGGVLFLLISGICVTLGKRHVRRGLILVGCGTVCTAATALMYLLGFADKGLVIWFGVLHCLGVCMLLWSPFSRFSQPMLGILGGAIIAVGLWVAPRITVDFPWLIPFGFCTPGFSTGDYFPLLPNLGFFLLGAVLGRALYRASHSRFPKVDTNRRFLRFLCGCGRYSLPIYLLHQPVLMLIMGLMTL